MIPMRTRLLTILIASVLTTEVLPVHAQEAGKIVDQYVKAAGGGKALARVQTLTLEGTFTTDDGKSGTYTLDTKLPNRYYSELLGGEKNLIAKEAATVGGVEEEVLYDDYRTVDGVKLPHKIELHRGSDKSNIEVSRAAINGTVGERVFDFPIKSQVKLPDLKALFKEIDDNQKALDKLKENYVGSQSEEETEFEGDGKGKKHDVNEYTVLHLNGDEISTLVH